MPVYLPHNVPVGVYVVVFILLLGLLGRLGLLSVHLLDGGQVTLLSARKGVIIILVHRVRHILKIKVGTENDEVKVELRELSAGLFLLTYQDREKNDMSTQTSNLQSNLALFAFFLGCGSLNLDATAISLNLEMSKLFGERNALRGFQTNNIHNNFYATKNHKLLFPFPRPVSSLCLSLSIIISSSSENWIIWTPPSASGNTTCLPAMKINLRSIS